MTFAYNEPLYFAGFLPCAVLAYQLCPKKYRWLVLLAFNYIFFFIWSRWLLVFNLITVMVTYWTGKILGGMKKAPAGTDRKAFKKKKTRIMTAGILFNLMILIVLKYTDFIGTNLGHLFSFEFHPFHWAVPVGISYYTLQSISYLADVRDRKTEPADHLYKLALYMSFFPAIMQGPISAWGQIGEDLSAGKDVSWNNLVVGFERILLGLFKKVMIADHMASAVKIIFADYTHDGAVALLGAVLCTLQLYMDFSGTIDIAIGSGRIFGVTLPENFRQPFFAKNASEFWRRWHITLGVFLRTYVFYPVSLSKPVQALTKWTKAHFGKTAARFVTPLTALFCVWICNGLWHGPYWTYILYGMYYFVIIFIELLLENPVKAFNERFHLDENGWGWKLFRFIKLFIIVIIGEMFFLAPDFNTGWQMLVSILTNFHLSSLMENWLNVGMGVHDYVIVIVGYVLIFLWGVLKETGYPLRHKFEKLPVYARWGLLYAVIAAVILFGAYGPGYDAVAMMYAGF